MEREPRPQKSISVQLCLRHEESADAIRADVAGSHRLKDLNSDVSINEASDGRKYGSSNLVKDEYTCLKSCQPSYLMTQTGFGHARERTLNMFWEELGPDRDALAPVF